MQQDVTPWNQTNDDSVTVAEQDIQEFKTKYEDFVIQQENYKKQKLIKINTSNARLEIKMLRKLITNNGWKEVTSDGNVCWLGLPFKYDNLDEYFTQFVNRFPGMDMLAHKTQSSFYLNKFAQHFPDEFEFFPKTYVIPEEFEKFQKEYKSTRTYIAKPDAGSQGDGIYLIKKPKDVRGNESMVIQQYISKPLLIDKKKFDLRLYVLITSLDPYIAYINYEGLARFCTVDYEKPNDKNLRDPFMHLTNYSLNKRNQNFKVYEGKNILDINDGTKRTFTSIKQNLQLLGYNVDDIQKEIDKLVASYLKSLMPFLHFNCKLVFQKRVDEVKCFHILGFDVLLDSKGKPWLLEVNSNPSLSIDHEVFGPDGKSYHEESYIDAYVKGLVMGDAIKLVLIPKDEQEQLQQFESYRKLDVDSNETVFNQMMQVYGHLSGYKFQDFLTASKFVKLSQFPNMTTQNFLKYDYDLLFRKVILKSGNNNQMDFFQFIEAIEQVAQRLNQGLGEMLTRVVQNL